jgi:ABC-type amino acid transport substrate-binding protein
MDSGAFRTAADLKGLKVSIQSKGTPVEYGFDRLLRPAGLSLADVDLQLMGFPNLLTALQTGGVDVGWEVEPFLSQSLGSGSARIGGLRHALRQPHLHRREISGSPTASLRQLAEARRRLMIRVAGCGAARRHLGQRVGRGLLQSHRLPLRPRRRERLLARHGT